MDAATVSRLISLIPERVVRAQTGTAFVDIRATSCVHPERVALLVEFLHWLSPIYPTTKDDQQRLGLFANKGGAHLDAEGEDAEDEIALEEEPMAEEPVA